MHHYPHSRPSDPLLNEFRWRLERESTRISASLIRDRTPRYPKTGGVFSLYFGKWARVVAG